MNYIIIILVSALVGCAGAPMSDPNPGSIDMGWKRVETRICGSHEVGENGCTFVDGNLGTVKLEVYRIGVGDLQITGCGIQKNIRYNLKSPEWISMNLSELLGVGGLEQDCVLEIYQRLEFPLQDQLEIPVQGIYGTVSLGRCPSGIHCSMQFEQRNVVLGIEQRLIPEAGATGQYMLTGCGQTLIPMAPYVGPLVLDLERAWPGGYPQMPANGKQGCMFILGLKTGGMGYKLYDKVWLIMRENVEMSEPTIAGRTFVGDRYTAATIVDGVIVRGGAGTYTPNVLGNYLRFYTVKGRSMVVFVQDGRIKWQK